MRYSGAIIDNGVITPRGIVKISNLNSGDEVIEYKTNRRYHVIGVNKFCARKMYLITYNDGRECVYYDNESLYISDDKKKCIHDIIEDELRNQSDQPVPVNCDKYYINKSFDFKQYPVEFDATGTVRKLVTPYIAGGLITCGDWSTDDILISSDHTKLIDAICNDYNFKPIESNHNGFIAFTRNNEYIKWSDMFPYYLFYRSNNESSDIIPNVYKILPINERWKFIMGVFDCGYDKEEFPDLIGILNKSKKILYEIRDMLASIGIMSNVRFFPISGNQYKERYVLEILNMNANTYPGFSYDYNNIAYLINTDAELEKYNNFHLKIRSINHIASYDTVYNFRTDKGIEMVYISDQYLPRISL